MSRGYNDRKPLYLEGDSNRSVPEMFKLVINSRGINFGRFVFLVVIISIPEVEMINYFKERKHEWELTCRTVVYCHSVKGWTEGVSLCIEVEQWQK